MKAAVLHQLGDMPRYEDFPDPVPEKNQLLITVKAASIKNLDKLRAGGKHYASYTHLPAIVGIDGVGVLEDGSRVYAQGIAGMMAEKALVEKGKYIILPMHIDDATAAALPNAVIGAAMALQYRAAMKKGNTILINGATGVTGQMAVQIAKHFGAAKVIATGRNQEMLDKLKELGADEIISLRQSDEDIIKRLKASHGDANIDIVIDYLWGHPMELILASLKGGGLHAFTPKVRIVTVGDMSGETIQLPSGLLRSSAIELLGSGIGSLSKEEMQEYSTKILPEMLQLAADNKLKIETEVVPLSDITAAWQKGDVPGKRVVVTM